MNFRIVLNNHKNYKLSTLIFIRTTVKTPITNIQLINSSASRGKIRTVERTTQELKKG